MSVDDKPLTPAFSSQAGSGSARADQPGRSRWIWPFPPVPARAARFVDLASGWATPLVSSGWWWILGAVVAGIVPLIISYGLRVPGHQVAEAALLFPLFLASVRQALPGKALLILVTAFVAHSAGVILLSERDATRIAPLLPGAEWFWTESLAWIESGHDSEYEVARWLPKHMLLFCAVVVLAYCSLGLTVLVRGFYEVDLMNYYVGRLIAQSSHTHTALIYGWHVWSLVRGIGCSLVIYEIVSLSFSALVGADRGRERGRRLRLCAGVGLLVVDGVLKFLLLDTVQARLQANLL